MRRDVRTALASLAIACLFIASAGPPAHAAMVEPGGPAVAIDPSGFVPPGGELVDSSTQTMTLTFTDPGTSLPLDVDLTFNNQVMRDPVTQQLTFVYELLDDGTTGPLVLSNAQTALSLSAFTGFSTDVSSNTAINVDRTADGATLNATASDVFAVQMPTVAIATDATAFNANGSVSGSISGDIFTPGGVGLPVSSTFALASLFQPVLDDGGGGGGDGDGDGDGNGGGDGDGGGGGGTPIPLPAGVWLGLVALAGSGVATRFRRKLRLI